ncbi:AAA ATPase midasin [Metarhizium acridum]|nr:AAA ATPase midasin [Metarhizium acridum]
MEVLWNTFRTHPHANKAVFDRSVEVDQLAARFDTLRWKASASIFDLSKAQQTLATAYRIVRDDSVPAEQLVADLTTAIQDLETRMDKKRKRRSPFFASECENLRQLFMLRSGQ